MRNTVDTLKLQNHLLYKGNLLQNINNFIVK